MARVAENICLAEDLVRLRRAERLPEAAGDVRPARRNLESRLPATFSRSFAARFLGVSQPALDRWVSAGEIPVVVTPSGRREVPRRFAIELREAIDELLRRGSRRPLAAALAARRKAAEKLPIPEVADRAAPTPPHGHETAERRGRAFHEVIARRLDETTLEDAREEVERLAGGGHLRERYAKRWRELLAGSPDEVAAAIVADTPEGRDLRQNSPFAGVVNEQERRRIVARVR
ncbi:MAG TPA: hypothetical protein VEQ41_05205 [Solirubrobacterales bacterium]|nr:hypothetical protein [Solirubrobacterales bacterium]